MIFERNGKTGQGFGGVERQAIHVWTSLPFSFRWMIERVVRSVREQTTDKPYRQPSSFLAPPVSKS